MKKRDKRGNIITENLIFIILNMVFLIMITLFLFSKVGASAVLEEKYSKQIALIIDSAEPGMVINLNMEDAIKKAEKERGKENMDDIVRINDNIVNIKIGEGNGYSYSFFNDVEVSEFLNTSNNREYVFVIDKRIEEEENE